MLEQMLSLSPFLRPKRDYPQIPTQNTIVVMAIRWLHSIPVTIIE
jgi:hypothetical protein